MNKQANITTHYEHEIPEGYEARIEGNKVIIELKESEDERIRKDIIEYFKGKRIYEGMQPMLESWIAYLERQKEQKPIKCIDFDNEFENQVSHLIASILNGEHEYSEEFVKYAVQSLLGYAKNELKPVEWSEEDEKMRENLLYLMLENDSQDGWEGTYEWLKSLRPQPHWKPSEEQMKVFAKATPVNLMPEELPVYVSLYNDLQKL